LVTDSAVREMYFLRRTRKILVPRCRFKGAQRGQVRQTKILTRIDHGYVNRICKTSKDN
jgi:hypothetical protein